MDAAALQAAGWSAHEAQGFTAYIAPLWVRGIPGAGRAAGFIADERHVNYQETVHGGALMTFADIALGWVATDALGHKRCVTAQLAIQLVSSPRVGDFVRCQAELVRCTSQMVFVRGLITVGDRTVASADGIWKVLAPKPQS
ncbi:MAG: PaaI family thioesterase [Hydrocarboniphaga sp.]|uniref:PaaI family thioesterase n=1 Tax=Hydrocarboniphaga sp. TaxID=2033016 RepID=UPI00262A4B12|nr:PaaI family thioesterase [Hydrocarboniphaga sp.]MDB5968619.1 PaaI family thioesterase [Hydrocarboniphaga sp.]